MFTYHFKSKWSDNWVVLGTYPATMFSALVLEFPRDLVFFEWM